MILTHLLMQRLQDLRVYHPQLLRGEQETSFKPIKAHLQCSPLFQYLLKLNYPLITPMTQHNSFFGFLLPWFISYALLCEMFMRIQTFFIAVFGSTRLPDFQPVVCASLGHFLFLALPSKLSNKTLLLFTNLPTSLFWLS